MAERGSGSQMERARQLVRSLGIIRPRDLTALGIPAVYLSRLVDEGLLEKVGRGLYRSNYSPPVEQHTLALVSHRVPHGVICLLSALRFHQLTTQSPFEVWLAVRDNAYVPRLDTIPLRVVRLREPGFSAGIEEHEVEGRRVRVYNPAKTLVDCFKFRNMVGLDVALEALRDGWRSRRFTMDQLWRYAKVTRMTNVIRPYLEGLL